MSLTTTDWLADVRHRAWLPPDASSFDSTTLMGIGDRADFELIRPEIQSLRADLTVRRKDYAITAGEARYRLPARACNTTLRDACVLDASGNFVCRPSQIGVQQIDELAGVTGAIQELTALAIEGYEVVLVPTPQNTGGTLRVRYYLRPSRLIAATPVTAGAAQISAIDPGTGVLTIPAHSGTFSTSTPIDLVQANSPYDVLAHDVTPSAVGATSVTVAVASLPDSLAVGDWLTLAGKAPVVTLPEELWGVHAQATACRILERLGDDRLQAALMVLGHEIKRALGAFVPRSHGRPRKLVNRVSPLRTAGPSGHRRTV